MNHNFEAKETLVTGKWETQTSIWNRRPQRWSPIALQSAVIASLRRRSREAEPLRSQYKLSLKMFQRQIATGAHSVRASRIFDLPALWTINSVFFSGLLSLFWCLNFFFVSLLNYFDTTRNEGGLVRSHVTKIWRNGVSIFGKKSRHFLE